MQTVKALRFRFCWAVAIVAVLSFGQMALAEVRLPKVFNHHMVMQQEKPLVIWGWANPSEVVKVQLGSSKAQTQANVNGEWKVELPAMTAGGPYTLSVTGSSNVQ